MVWKKDSFERCRAGIFYVLNELAGEGHCFSNFDGLVIKSSEMLEIEQPKMVMTIGHLLIEKELIKEKDDMVYLQPFYYAESGTAKRIKTIATTKNANVFSNINETITQLQNKFNIKYDQTQIKAIKQAVSTKFSVITGGPGTGKTTLTRSVIEFFMINGKSVVLAAPTGRAAKRMAEMCGIESKLFIACWKAIL